MTFLHQGSSRERNQTNLQVAVLGRNVVSFWQTPCRGFIGAVETALSSRRLELMRDVYVSQGDLLYSLQITFAKGMDVVTARDLECGPIRAVFCNLSRLDTMKDKSVYRISLTHMNARNMCI
jgi:hypothetical protein